MIFIALSYFTQKLSADFQTFEIGSKEYKFSEFKERYNGNNLMGENNCKEILRPGSHILFSKTLTLQENKNIKAVDHASWCKGFEREDELLKLESEIEKLLDLNKYGKNN